MSERPDTEEPPEARVFACCGGVLIHALECRGRPSQGRALELDPERDALLTD